MKRFLFTFFMLTACVALGAEDHGHPEGFKPSADLDRFYSEAGRNVRVTINTTQELHTVSEHFLGINTSYFNDTDEVWETYGIPAKLKKAGVRALRYPGGEEASFFHWEHPGVNGYEDLWDDPKEYGHSRKRGPFQTTWVDPAKWATNEDFMNFDEFMVHCRNIGAEPIVGLNLSSGARHNREAEGVEEALRWMRYCKEKGYKVTYWFLDNEPWNFEAAHQMYVKPYAAECVRYGKAIKAEFPNVKLIANPFSSETYNAWQEVEYFVRTAGEVVDYIDIHYYWEWGRSTFEQWKKTTPLETGDKWKHDNLIRTYQKDFSMLREAFAKAGHPDMGLMVLEWNIAPSDESLTFSQSANALIHSELLMEFMRADIHIACLWPLLWRTSRDVWAEQDPFPSVITQEAPYTPTLTHDLFRMISPLQGMQLVKTEASENDIVVMAGRTGDHQKILLLNKNPLRRKITLEWETPPRENRVETEYLAIRNQVPMKRGPRTVEDRTLELFVEPFSFNVLTLSKTEEK
jgi:hypothetical protein